MRHRSNARTGILACLFILPIIAGCVSPAAPSATAPNSGEPAIAAALEFTVPARLNPEGGNGYEPSILVAPDGTILVSAHKARNFFEGTRLASWLWFSRDGGNSWREMPSSAQFHDKLFAFEGDFAIDDNQRLYFVDTHAADTHLSRWQLGLGDPIWEFTRPLQGTTSRDDRPWLASHGDGIVYYLANDGIPPAPNTVRERPTEGVRIWFYRSEDAGITWSLGYGFPRSGWCDLEASKREFGTVFVGCSIGQYYGPNVTASVFTSRDRGRTWQETKLGPYEAGPGPWFPSTTSDAAGVAYHAFIDDNHRDEVPGRIRVARSIDGVSWDLLDLTPFVGAFGMVWVSGGSSGVVAVSFYGTWDTKTGPQTEWHPYVLLSTDAHAAGPTWHLTQLDRNPNFVGATPPGDFFQNAIGPDGAVHVSYNKRPSVVAGPIPTWATGFESDVMYVRQLSGPNLLAPAEADTAATPGVGG